MPRAVVLLLVLACAAPGAAQELPAPAGLPAAPPAPVFAGDLPTVGAYLRGLPDDLAAAGSSLASVRTLPWALGGAAATAFAATVDDGVRDWFRSHHPLEGASGAGDVLGQGYTHAGVALGLFTFGRLARSRRETEAGAAAAEALIVNSLVTVGLKTATRRARPGDGARNAFPSGHASSTAALGASLAAVYDWRPGIAVPLGLLTVFVGASRLEDDVHWGSDVVAGIALGGLIGAAVGNSRRQRPPRNWAVLPSIPAAGGGGLLVAFPF